MRRVEAKTCFYPFLGKITLCHVGEIDEGGLFQQSRLFIPAMGPKCKLFTSKNLSRFQNMVLGLYTDLFDLLREISQKCTITLVKQIYFFHIV